METDLKSRLMKSHVSLEGGYASLSLLVTSSTYRIDRDIRWVDYWPISFRWTALKQQSRSGIITWGDWYFNGMAIDVRALTELKDILDTADILRKRMIALMVGTSPMSIYATITGPMFTEMFFDYRIGKLVRRNEIIDPSWELYTALGTGDTRSGTALQFLAANEQDARDAIAEYVSDSSASDSVKRQAAAWDKNKNAVIKENVIIIDKYWHVPFEVKADMLKSIDVSDIDPIILRTAVR